MKYIKNKSKNKDNNQIKKLKRALSLAIESLYFNTQIYLRKPQNLERFKKETYIYFIRQAQKDIQR